MLICVGFPIGLNKDSHQVTPPKAQTHSWQGEGGRGGPHIKQVRSSRPGATLLGVTGGVSKLPHRDRNQQPTTGLQGGNLDNNVHLSQAGKRVGAGEYIHLYTYSG